MLAASVFAAALMAACGGGGGGSSSSGAPAPVATAAPTNDPIQLFLVPASDAGSPVTQPSPGQIGVNTVSIPFTAVGQTQGVLVYEPNFSGTFGAAVKECTGTSTGVTVTPASYTGLSRGVFVITAAAAGFCEVAVQDGTNGATILVDITTTSGTISGIKRH
jgi:hypothetical protein